MELLTFLPKVIDAVFSDAGILAACMLMALLYQTKKYNEKDSEVKALNNQILQLATSQIAAMKEVQRVLEIIVDKLPKIEDNNNV